MEGSTLAGKALVVAAVFAVLFTVERAWPAVPRRGGWRRVGRNLGLWAMNAGLSPLLVVPLTAWAATLAPWQRPAWWGGAPGLVLDLVLLDFWIYWWHRANHEVPLLWRFHVVHHLDGFLDTTTALRFHFGEVILSAGVRALAVAALAIPLASVLTFEAAVLVAALFHHSDIRIPPRLEAALSQAIITPAIHWVHHHAVRADTDSNYGTMLSLWDRLFASRSLSPRTPAMAIGVESMGERPLGVLLLAPFLPRR